MFLLKVILACWPAWSWVSAGGVVNHSWHHNSNRCDPDKSKWQILNSGLKNESETVVGYRTRTATTVHRHEPDTKRQRTLPNSWELWPEYEHTFTSPLQHSWVARRYVISATVGNSAAASRLRHPPPSSTTAEASVLRLGVENSTTQPTDIILLSLACVVL